MITQPLFCKICFAVRAKYVAYIQSTRLLAGQTMRGWEEDIGAFVNQLHKQPRRSLIGPATV